MRKPRTTRRAHTGGRRRPRRSRCAGFSLLELSLVIAIIAVLGALAAPRFTNAAARQRLESAALRLEADLRHARHHAQAASDTVTVKFLTEGKLVLLDNQGGTIAITDYDAEPYNVKIAAVLDNDATMIQVNGFGYPDTGGTLSLTGGGATIRFDLDPLTGEVTRR